MIVRQVKATRKDPNGNITQLCNEDEWWSPESSVEVIRDIETGSYRYYVQVGLATQVNIHVAGTGSNKYLRTDPDSTLINNLDELPDC